EGVGFGRYLGPTTEQRPTSSVEVIVISPVAATALISLSENNCTGVKPESKVIWASCQSGLGSPRLSEATTLPSPTRVGSRQANGEARKGSWPVVPVRQPRPNP